jgi:flagellar M-ring protein FliF
VKSLLENLQALGTRRLMMLGGVGALIVVGIVAASIMMSQSSMTVLYSKLSPAEAARVGQALKEIGIDFDMQEDAGAVLVSPKEARKARMALAERGLPANSSAGWELFDDAGALGLTSFMQQVTKTRALEGELARTIQTMDGVLAARVHLVLPERDAFSRAAATPSASVFVRMGDATHMAREKALAIQRLVSAAVPALALKNVTVLDSSGEVLVAEGEGSANAARGTEYRAELEEGMSESIRRLLTPYLGQGNFRVAVTADIDLDREVIAEETFDPDSRVERSRRNFSENENATDTSTEPPVSVAQNLPEEEISNGAGSSSSSTTERVEETINYEISSVRRERVSEAGKVERLNVAILVDGVRGVDASGAETYEPRSEEDLAKIATIVRTAAGFDASRGDVVTVENVKFIERVQDLEPVGTPTLTEVVMHNLGTVIQSLVLLLIVGLLTVFGLKPVVSRLMETNRERRKTALEALEEEEAGEGEAAAALAFEGGAENVAGALEDRRAQAEAQLSGGTGTDKFMENMIQLRSVEGKVRESSIAKLGEIVDEYPEEAVNILRAWVYEERSA